MTRHERLLMRLAIAIREQSSMEQCSRVNVELPTTIWHQFGSLLRQLNQAQQRGWQLAARRVQRDLRATFRKLQDGLIAIGSILEPSPTESRLASTRDIYADLVSLHQEFDEVSFDRLGRTLSATTEPIELEGIYLGPFEIRLNWGDLPKGRPHNYRVIAIDAHPAVSNESVTHPHVQDEFVCEGEGHQPIRNALDQRRLLDFFIIVANLLRTYNSDSPYVSLPDWRGVACADCGTTFCEDERWTCEQCETMMCGECHFNCPGCDGIYCSECVTRCESCDESHCRVCMNHCLRCRAEFCRGCLNENERCSDCYEQEMEETDEENLDVVESDGRSDVIGSIQSDGMGETAFPA